MVIQIVMAKWASYVLRGSDNSSAAQGGDVNVKPNSAPPSTRLTIRIITHALVFDSSPRPVLSRGVILQSNCRAGRQFDS
jgi:hypothetical protein